MTPPDLSELMEKAKQIQSRLAEVQRELAVRRFEADAGGGMVKAVVTGELRVLEVRIEQALLDSGDREMIQDLTAAAVNAALSTAQATVQQELQRASTGLSLPNPFGSSS